MTYPLKNRKPVHSNDPLRCYYESGIDGLGLLEDILADGAKLPLAAMVAIQKVLREDDDAELAAYWARGNWWNVEVVSTVGKMSPDHLKLMKNAGGRLFHGNDGAEWSL